MSQHEGHVGNGNYIA